MRIPDGLQDVFLIEKDTRDSRTRRDGHTPCLTMIPASDTFKPNATGVVSCGFTCHTRVAAKDYIFTAYGKR